MTLSQKENTLLQDLKSHEQLCVEKYSKYASDATSCQLKNLFSHLSSIEQQHLNTINQIIGGTVPQTSAGNSQQQNSSSAQMLKADYTAESKQKDQYLCQDALSTEKHVSSVYDTCIFEFKDPNLRNALNHIQKEEQQHGEQIYSFMAQNGMYS
jgi:spore coat protein CotF